jgi:2-phosphosulfolactate phosphatase
MKSPVDLVLTPADLRQLSEDRFREATCVVFDVLRATTTIAAALHNGAVDVRVVGEIEEALALRAQDGRLVLAGERGGQRITAAQTGSIDFDLGNSPGEFTPEQVGHRRVVITTTNGTRAIQGCRGARHILAASFLNLSATARALCHASAGQVFLVCAGTGSGFSLEDTLGAGALLALLPRDRFDRTSDACRMAEVLYQTLGGSLETAFRTTANGRRLAADPALAPDLAFCAQRDLVPYPIPVLEGRARLDDQRPAPS